MLVHRRFLHTSPLPLLAYVASVSVGFSAPSKHFWLFGREKKFRAAKERNMLQTHGNAQVTSLRNLHFTRYVASNQQDYSTRSASFLSSPPNNKCIKLKQKQTLRCLCVLVLLPLSILIILDSKSLATALGSRTLSVHMEPAFRITGSEEGQRTSVNNNDR